MATKKILKFIKILTWVVFVGLLIQAGAIIISYLVSLGNPEGAKNLFLGLNLFDLRSFSLRHYTVAVFFITAMVCLKAYAAYLAIKLLSELNLSNPFENQMAKLVEKISYVVIVIGGTATMASIHNKWLQKNGIAMLDRWEPGEILFLAGIIFIIAQIFKRGVEIQSENELTI